MNAAGPRHKSWNATFVAASLVVTIGLAIASFAQEPAPARDPVPVPVPEFLPEVPQLPPIQPEPGLPGTGADIERPQLFVTDRTASRRLTMAEARLKKGIYDEAVDLLQIVLDAEEDSSSPPEGQDDVFRSLKGQANDLLERLPPEGRRVYELKYGIAAQAQLENAVKTADWDQIEAISRRYFHTPAGREATYRLAAWFDDRGDSLEAALLFQRLAGDHEAAFQPRLSLRTAAAWAKAGVDDLARDAATRYLELAQGQAGPTVIPASEKTSPERLVAWLKTTTGHSDDSMRSRWPTLGGSARRVAEVEPVSIGSGLAWSHELHAGTPWDNARASTTASRLASGLELLTADATQSGKLTQPALHPVVADNTVIFRTLRNIQAVDLTTGELRWQTEPPHDHYFDEAVARLAMLIPFGSDASTSGMISLGTPIAQLAWQNLTAGTLSTDGQYVYGVEGTGNAGGSRYVDIRQGRPVLVGNYDFNTLYAYDLAAEGRVAWTAGGAATDDPASGAFFLGPPLSLGGQLYVLAERAGAIELLVLDPKATASQRVSWSQTLVQADRSLASDPLRRVSGLSPAFADGVLVCPTGAGAAVAIDLGRRILLWGYQYPAGPEPEQNDPARRIFFNHVPLNRTSEDELRRWLDAVPRIVDDAVFLTPRDSSELHCLDLKSGEVRWKHARGTSLYLATVHDGLAILVGRQSIGALDVDTGEQVWEQPLNEMPAGRGVHSGDLYHLPLASGEIATFRLSSHQELVRSPIGAGLQPGNLIAVRGRLISQSTKAIVAFPPKEELDATYRPDGNQTPDAAKLAAQGTYELHRGEVVAGLRLLKEALELADLPDARHTYVQVLLEGLRSDFASYRRYESDLQTIIEDPAQKAAFLRLLATGLSAEGEKEAALHAFLNLAALESAVPSYQRTDDGRRVRDDRLDSLRIAALLQRLSADEVAAFEAKLSVEGDRAASERNVGVLERLATSFRGTRAGATALQVLARLYQQDGELLKYERVVLESTQDAAGIADADIAAVLPLETRSEAAGLARFSFDLSYRGEYLPDEIRSGRTTKVEPQYAMRTSGWRPEELAGWTFALALNPQSVVARDPTGQERWRVPLQQAGRHNGNLASIGRSRICFSGRLMAVAAGTRLAMLDVATDASRPSVLWYGDLTDRRFVELDSRSMNNVAEGPIGFAGAGLFVYQTGTTITAVEPLTGEVLWERPETPLNCEISGDGEFVTLQFPNRGDVLVLQGSDGSTVARRSLPRSHVTLGWSGTKVLSWRPAGQGLQLAFHDAARQADIWTRQFTNTALATALPDDQVAILEPASGELTVLRWQDGTTVFEAALEQDPDVTEFGVLRHFGRWVVLTRRNTTPVRVDLHRTHFPIHGLVYGLDDMGKRIWSAAIDRQYVRRNQPQGLPVLLLAANRNPFGSDAKHHAVLLDVRTGQSVIDQGRGANFQPFELQGDVTTDSIEAATDGARFLLTPVGDPLPPARSDGLAELADIAGNAFFLGQP